MSEGSHIDAGHMLEEERRQRVARARAIGGWLNQEWDSQLLGAVNAAKTYMGQHEEDANAVFDGAGRVKTFITDLRSLPDVVFNVTDGGGTIAATPELRKNSRPEEPSDGIYRFTGKNYQDFCSTLNHTVNGAITPGYGVAQNLRSRGEFTLENAMILAGLGKVQQDVVNLQQDTTGNRYSGIEIHVSKGKKIEVKPILQQTA